jgi:formylmethanofuran dehydrogenase subunit E
MRGKAVNIGKETRGTEQTGTFETLLAESARLHGHLCPGQVLGVRMSMLGLREIGIMDPKGADRKSLIVFVEMDRCATDAVQSVTGCSLGHRTLKFMDYGKMAVTYFNLKTGKAVRVIAREDTRDIAKNYCPDICDKYEAQTEAYKMMSDDELFEIMEVEVELLPQDMPGRPISHVRCAVCGEAVQDMRYVQMGSCVTCVPCSGGNYFKVKNAQEKVF